MEDRRCVRSGGYFIPIDSPYLNTIKNKYTCDNPAFAQAHALRDKGKWVNIPDAQVYACQTIPIWHRWGGGLMIPRGIDLSEYDFRHIDRTSAPEQRIEDTELELADGIKLRDYQQEGVDAFAREGQGVIVAPCGAGKTMMGIGAMVEKSTRTVILVHTKDLAEQWKSRIEAQVRTQYGDAPTVSLWPGKKRDLSGQVVIAMFQSLAKLRFNELLEFGKNFGLCIVDEAHHVPASTFSSVMMGMSAKYRLALTATPDRPDGLSDILYWHFGKTLKRIETADLIEAGRVLAPTVHFFATLWKPNVFGEWTKLIKAMVEDEERNDKILDLVERFAVDGRQVLVLSDRVNHCERLAEATANRGISAATLVGKMTKNQRAEVLELAEKRELKAVFATTVADEGLDLPGLDTLILTTPTKSMGRIQQRIGRIMRFAEDKKEPIVVDCVDAVKSLFYMHNKRSRFYKELGCKVKEISREVSP